MATSTTYSGGLQSTPAFTVAFSGDSDGSQQVRDALSITFSAAGGDAPTLSGFLKGDLSVTGAQDILLAHATDPLQSAGDGGYSTGFTVAGAKLKFLRIRNTHASASLKVERGTNGLPVFDATGDSITIPAGGYVDWYFPAGTAALTSGSNDKLVLTPSAGTVTGVLLAAYGP